MDRRFRAHILVVRLLAVSALFGAFCCGTLAQSIPPYRNPKVPVEQRVADLMSRMTLQEKIAQLAGTWQS
ncbi:MAG: hypothetical protein ACRD4X_06285, partial [Candidatus Acidiferrales bacterium]